VSGSPRALLGDRTRGRPHEQRILDALAEVGFALPGSLVSRITACGKPGCRCQADPPVPHGPYRSWTRAVRGKTITRRITPDQEQRYQTWFDNHRRLRALVAELESLSTRAAEEAEGWNKPR
jgi:hypothetical protein